MIYKNTKKQDPQVFKIVEGEMKRQQEGMELIASENYVSEAVMETLSTVFTNKYSEGYPGRRYYGGQTYTDQVETLAIERAKKVFGAQHVNVQPLSGSPANFEVYTALLEPGDTILGMDLSHGGHLSHGHPMTIMAKIYRFVNYKTEQDGSIDYDKLEKLAKKEKPKLMLAGFSSYTRMIDYERFTTIAKKVGAYSMFDIAHIAGLIAGKAIPSPVPFFDVVTTTTHKTLRGPRGAMIMCKQELAQKIDKAVFPGVQGGPHMNNIAAKAVAFGEALKPSYKAYAKQVVKNAKVLEKELTKRGYKIMFGGTDYHMVLVDMMSSKGVTGKQAEIALDEAAITVNKNVIPDDPRSPLDPSGVRIGVQAVTSRGMKEKEVKQIVEWIDQIVTNYDNKKELEKIRKEVVKFCKRFPLFPKV